MDYRKSDPYPTKHHGHVITPEILVMHTTEGGSKLWLNHAFSGLNVGYRLSVHWCVYHDGEVVEYAPWKPGEAVACWHAGTSEWKGRSSCNYWSLGFEIQHIKGETYPEAQVQAVIDLMALIKSEYPGIEPVTHQQIAPLRKSDPTAPWKTDVWPRVKQAWENNMEIDNVTPATAQPEMDKLVRAGIITKPEAHDLADAAGVGLLFTIAGRIAEKAGLVPPQ